MKYPNSPWQERFPLKDTDLKQWEAKKDGSSLLLWALGKSLIDRQKYFDWAMEHYELPLLSSDFFEYVVMGQNQWKRVKDLKEWSREVLPVWEWENMAYVGCMEPPKDHENWNFPHRLVLVTDRALKMHWKSVRDFSDLLPKTTAPPIQAKPRAENLFPAEDPDQPSYDPMGEPVRQTSDPAETADPTQRDNILAMDQFKTQQKQAPPTEESPALVSAQKDDSFTALGEQTKPFFSGILLLKNVDNLLYPKKWAGRIQITNETKPLISLAENSVFSVLLKGFDYHGFVVENESNKKFFNNISWSVLPKHITAIPIPGAHKKTEQVFLGIAIKPLPYETLNSIKKIVLPFLAETSQKQAA